MKEALNHSMNFTQTNTVKEDRNPKITFYVIISDCRHVLSCKLFCRKTALYVSPLISDDNSGN